MSRPCRVCGLMFTPPRFDARTCSDTCRKRLSRGHDLEYLAGLSAKERREHQSYHDKFDADLAEYRKLKVAEQKERREKRDQRAAEKRDRFLAEMLGRPLLAQQREREAAKRQQLICNVNGVVKLFTMEHREITVEAIVEFLKGDERYSTGFVTEALDELRASGDYDRTIKGEW
jgi:hypothetical protein